MIERDAMRSVDLGLRPVASAGLKALCAALFVGFSNDRRFFVLVLILFVFFVLLFLLIIIGISRPRRIADKRPVDQPGGKRTWEYPESCQLLS